MAKQLSRRLQSIWPVQCRLAHLTCRRTRTPFLLHQDIGKGATSLLMSLQNGTHSSLRQYEHAGSQHAADMQPTCSQYINSWQACRLDSGICTICIVVLLSNRSSNDSILTRHRCCGVAVHPEHLPQQGLVSISAGDGEHRDFCRHIEGPALLIPCFALYPSAC